MNMEMSTKDEYHWKDENVVFLLRIMIHYNEVLRSVELRRLYLLNKFLIQTYSTMVIDNKKWSFTTSADWSQWWLIVGIVDWIITKWNCSTFLIKNQLKFLSQISSSIASVNSSSSLNSVLNKHHTLRIAIPVW